MTDTNPEGPYKVDSVNINVVEFCDPTGQFPPIAVSGLHPGTKMVDIENIVNRFFNAGRASRDRLREALNEIASWTQGPIVTGSFDEPDSADRARKALAEDEKYGK